MKSTEVVALGYRYPTPSAATELAAAIAKHQRGDGDPDNLEEEFADMLAWLATLANITGVDLARAIENKYPKDGGPKGTK